jgi:two-component system cell cycle sensor histidine kinase/response regulator CckA
VDFADSVHFGSGIVPWMDGEDGEDGEGGDDRARGQAEILQALQRSERRFRVLNERSPVAVLETDLEGRVVYANPRLREMYGIEADAPLGFRWTDMIHPDERAHAAGARETAFQDGAPMTLVHRIVSKDGTVRWVEGTSVPLHDEEGQTIGRMAVAVDVTRRLAAEKALEESQAQYRRIVETASEGIWVLDAQERTTFVNPAMAEALGYTPAEMIGRRAQDFIAKGDVTDYDRQMADRERGGANRYERQFRHKGGGTVWMSISAQPVRDANGKHDGSFGMFTDVTDKKLAEDRRAELEAQLRQSQKMEAVGKLSGGIAHDFNNLLTVIGANASLLEDDPDLRADYRESAHEITQATETAAGLTRQLLAFSRRQELRKGVFDLNKVVARMSEMLRRIVGESVHIDVRCLSEPVYVNADTTMIEQVLMNLVVNANDAMERGGQLTIEVRREAGGAFVTLRVSDSGAGIAPEVLPHIFEPFFTTKGVGRGAGLGLATVYGIVEQHGGWVTVESRVGVGSTFDVHLPSVAAG